MIDRPRRILVSSIAVFIVSLGAACSLGAQAPSTPSSPAAQTPSTTAAEPHDWKTYSYQTDGFSASFPVAPELQKKDIPTSAGSFELRSYIAEFEPVALFVGVVDYGSAAQGRDPDDMLKGAENGALTNSNAHLVSDKKITLGVYHGMEFEAESDTAHFSARIYVVGATLYQTLAVYPIGKPYDGTTRFLDSFQLIARDAK